jgi:hypothetical protein
MGEYEDRYPDAYGRDEPPAPTPPRPEDRREAPARQARERFSRRGLLGAGTPSEAAASSAAWQHAPAAPVQTIEPTARPVSARPAARDYRGVGPRGYVRGPTRIYEDICDRLTDHPLIDASDIEVSISGIQVTLQGSVDNAITAGRAEAIAREVPGVKAVRNTLTVRDGGQTGPPRPSPPIDRQR